VPRSASCHLYGREPSGAGFASGTAAAGSDPGRWSCGDHRLVRWYLHCRTTAETV